MKKFLNNAYAEPDCEMIVTNDTICWEGQDSDGNAYQIKFYYRTAWNSAIRCINLNSINFARVQYHTAPLDKEHEQIHYCN